MVAYARRVGHLIIDPKAKNAIDVAERYANGEATDEELNAAWAASSAAAGAAAWAASWAVAGAVARAGIISFDPAIAAAREAERTWQEREFLRVVTQKQG